MKLRVLSFNAWAMMRPLDRDVLARMRAVGEALPALELDVAAFQEVWQAEARAALIASGARAGLLHAWHRKQAATGSGLLVLSRAPIADARFEAFELGGWPEAVTHGDYWGGKGFAELTLATAAGELRLFDTHLHAAYVEREQDAYIGHRVGQVLQIAERINAVETPVIAAGDFNFEEVFEEHGILTGLTGLSDVALSLDARQATALRTNPYRRSEDARDERIDYLFCRAAERRGITPTRIERVLDDEFTLAEQRAAYSDHAGLVAEFELQAAEVPGPARNGDTLDTARRLLTTARADALGRRSAQRSLAGSGAAAAAAAYFARSRAVTRRSILRGGLTALGVASGLVGLSGLTASEVWRDEELAGFESALARAERLERELSSPAAADLAASRAPSRR